MMIIMVDVLDECIERDKDNIFILLNEKILCLLFFVKFLFIFCNIFLIWERFLFGVIFYNNLRFKENVELDIKWYLEKRLENDIVWK